MRRVYFYDLGVSHGQYEFSVDFYGGRGKNMQYIRARRYWVERLKKLLYYPAFGVLWQEMART